MNYAIGYPNINYGYPKMKLYPQFDILYILLFIFGYRKYVCFRKYFEVSKNHASLRISIKKNEKK